MSSELSNALNPDIVTTRRSRPAYTHVADVSPAPVVEPRPFVPHRSELELAIAEPPPRPAPAPSQACTPAPRTVVHEVLRVLSATKEAAEAEKRRRLTWEQEQEVKSAQRQAEMQKELLDMRQEVSMLKACMTLHPLLDPPQSNVNSQPSAHIETIETPFDGFQPQSSALQTFSITSPPGLTPSMGQASTTSSRLSLPEASSVQSPLALLTPDSENPQYQSPVYDHDGLSPQPFATPQPYSPDTWEPRHRSAEETPGSTSTTLQTSEARVDTTRHESPSFRGRTPPQPHETPGTYRPVSPPDPHVTQAVPREPAYSGLPTPQANDSVSRSPTPVTTLRKRPAPAAQSDADDDSDSSDDAESPVGERSRKRANGHDGRCLTIHHAMRLHLLQLMKLERDESLPDSHVEGRQLLPDEPVRFVWEKTSKQSAHNTAMKKRVVADLKANRGAYKYVPEKDFTRRNLESVFDQVYTTLRQKFKAQKDSTAALNLKRREDQKAMKARRLSRKKLKLANRIETRKKLETFSHPAFDGALQQDCMSSEESCEEEAEPSSNPGSSRKVQALRIRGLPWRSVRLQRFYAVLDEEEHAEKSTKPKRGVGRKERRIGPYKEGVGLPPVGVASWMISKRWMRLLQMTRPDLAALSRNVVVDPPDFDWTQCLVLGAESDDELEVQEILPADAYIPYSDTSYSLQYALTPMP